MPNPRIGRRELLLQTAALAAARAASAQQAAPQTEALFPGFRAEKIKTAGATIHAVSGGRGPGLLLLHGYPQTHAEWHKLAPDLAKEFTVVAADLRGYGDSSKPPEGENHVNYSKKAMAADFAEVMTHYGFDQFMVVGHDRGGRVAHRLALDHSNRVTKLAVIDIVPSLKVYASVNKEFATGYYHWFFLIQPAPFPETLIQNSYDFFINRSFRALMPKAVTPEAFAEYHRALKNPEALHAACEDYRAGASIDLDHDRADLGKKVACPLLALWAERGLMGRLFDVLATWRERASDVRGKALPGGHFLPEEMPEQTLTELQAFLRG